MDYFYGTIPVNEAIAMIVKYWAAEVILWSRGDDVFISIDSDGLITLGTPDPPKEKP